MCLAKKFLLEMLIRIFFWLLMFQFTEKDGKSTILVKKCRTQLLLTNYQKSEEMKCYFFPWNSLIRINSKNVKKLIGESRKNISIKLLNKCKTKNIKFCFWNHAAFLSQIRISMQYTKSSCISVSVYYGTRTILLCYFSCSPQNKTTTAAY